jgi:hypothetical protein
MASFFDTLFGGGAQEDAAAKNALALQQYYGTALPALQSGYQTGVTNLNQAVGAYTPLATMGAEYGKGGTLYLDALGANGPDAQKRAMASFQTTPGYQLSEAAGEDAINRQRGATGMFNSGNAAEDLLKFGENNLYQTQYAPWMAGLQSAGQTGVGATGAAATGQAAGYGGLANLGYQYGSDQGSLIGNVTSGTMADNNMVAAGQAAGAKNLLGAGLSLATLGLGGNFGGGGGGSILSGLMGNYGSVAGMPATGAGAPSFGASNAYALSQGINPWA